MRGTLHAVGVLDMRGAAAPGKEEAKAAMPCDLGNLIGGGEGGGGKRWKTC